MNAMSYEVIVLVGIVKLSDLRSRGSVLGGSSLLGYDALLLGELFTMF